jgi:integrase
MGPSVTSLVLTVPQRPHTETHEHNVRKSASWTAGNPFEDKLRAQIGRLLGRISDANRSFASDRVKEREARGCKLRSQVHFLQVVVQTDAAFNGAPFRDVKPVELAELVAAWRRTKADTTLAVHAMYLRLTWRVVLEVKDLPPAYERALAVPEPKRRARGRALTECEFDKLVRAVIAQDEGTPRIRRTPMMVAACWVLRDVGFRARELLSLNHADVSFKTVQGVESVALRLREGVPDLKTGARPTAGVRCVGPLKAWLAIHPRPSDPIAPVFVGLRDSTGTKRLAYKELWKTISRAGRAAGLSETPANPDKIGPHDLRHTCATEKARTAGWNELMMRDFFGWRAGSDMPSLYSHLTFADLEAQVMRDAGFQHSSAASPLAIAVGEIADDAVVKAALVRLLGLSN